MEPYLGGQCNLGAAQVFIVLAKSYDIVCVGPFECQDGATNNCSKNCTRHLIDDSSQATSYKYECECDFGYAADHFGYCEGENLLEQKLLLS